MINNPKMNFSFRPIMIIFLKVRKRKIALSIISGAIIFLVVTSFFMVWFSNKSTLFNNYMEENNSNWQNDHQISVSVSEYIEKDNQNKRFPSTYIIDGFNEIYKTLDEFIPSVLTNNYTALLSVETYHTNETSLEADTFAINVLNEDANEVIANNLLAGRMPINASELLYYQKIPSNRTYDINSTISMSVTTGYNSSVQDFLIVGIIGDLENILYQNGFSTDILNWRENVIIDDTTLPDTYLFSPEEIFFTTPNLYALLLNNYPEFGNGFALLYDFNYDISALNVRRLSEIINYHQKLMREMREEFNFQFYLKIESPVILCLDLFSALTNFQSFWVQETVKIVAFGIPLILLLLFIVGEIFVIDSSELKSNIYLLKLNGLDDITIQKVLLIETFIFATSSFIIGFFFGIVVGYFSILSMKRNVSFGYYLNSISEKLLIFLLISSWLLFIIGRFLVSNRVLKSTRIFKSEHLLSKRKKILRKFRSIPELLTFLFGIISLAIGIPGFILTEAVPHLIWNYTYNDYQISLFIFWLLIYLGCILLALCMFLLISRFLIWFWTFLGEKIWNSTKNFLTLSLKTLSINSKDYRRMIVVILILGLGIVPGITLNKSLENHHSFEADLATGCTDLVIPDWNFNQSLRDEFLTLKDIKGTVELKKIELFYRTSTGVDAIRYNIKILAIVNPINFNNIIDFSKLNNAGFNKEDISSLMIDMSYLMDENFAKKNDYDQGIILFNSNISKVSEEYALTYINSFKFFPTLSLHKELPYQKIWIAFSLVTNLQTSQIIVNATENTKITEKGILLIKTVNGSNNDDLKERLREQFGVAALTKSDFKQSFEDISGNLTIIFATISTVLTIFLGIMFNFLTAQRIYHQRKRIIESEYHLGATRKQIWGGFTLEIIFLNILPLIVSIIIGSLFLRLLAGIMTNSRESYVQFNPWSPCWLNILLICLGLVIMVSGWLLAIIPLIRSYQSIRQE